MVPSARRRQLALQLFEAALVSSKITYQQGKGPMAAAVKVSWKGATWPMVVRLKDAAGFGAIMASIKGPVAAGAGTTGEFEGEVSCISQK